MKTLIRKYLVIISVLCLLAQASLSQNVPGAIVNTSTQVTVKVTGNNIVMANGIISMTVNKTNAQITALSYNGVDLLGVGDGNGNTFYWGWTPTTLGYEETPANCTYTLVADPATNGGSYAEILLSRPYDTTKGALAAWDVNMHYSLLKGSQGFYASGVFSRPANYPAYIMGETRFLGKINNGIFDWFSQDSLRNDFMPTLPDQASSVAVTNAPKEVTLVTEGDFTGEYLCKYSYTGDFGDMRVWGWSSVNETTDDPAPNPATITGKNIGMWMTCPSIEYYNGGPMKREITWVFLNMLNGEHYGMGDSFAFAEGETYQKIYGPFFIYCNTYNGAAGASPSTIANSLFSDAQAQTQAEANAWPYTWFNNTAYPQKSARATVSGTFTITDPGNTAASSAGMWIGLAPDSGDFQHQAKTYQFWVKTGANGSFTIPNVRPGTYNLNAFGPGSPGTFQQKNIIVAAGQTLNLGTINWTPPRTGPTVWEIGIPNRDSKEFFNGYSSAAGILPPYSLWPTSFINYPTQFPNGVNYTVGTSNWATDWNYAQVCNANNNWSTSPWTINFTLNNAPTAGTKAAFHLALASNYTSHLDITVNGTQIYSSAMANGSDAVIRLASHGAFYDSAIVFNSNLLKKGANTIILNQVKAAEGNTIEYDYLRLEATGTGNVAPLASITAASTTTFCSGGSVVLNANTGAGYTYQWNKGDTTISGATAASYKATISGSYTVIVTAYGLSNTSLETIVTVNPLPMATITPITTTAFCAGDSVILTANTGTGLTYQWNKGGTSITGATAASYIATIAGNYTLTVSNNTNCTNTSAAISVTISTPPSTSTAGSDQYITTTTANLSANTPTTGTGTWSVVSGKATFANATSATTSVSELNTGANVLQWTISNGTCPASSSIVTINVGTSPTIQTIIGPDTLIADETGIVYSVPDDSGSIYHWTLPLGATITSANTDSSSIKVNFGSKGGNITVRQTNPYGEAASMLSVSVGYTPTLQAITGPDSVTANQTGVLYSIPDSTGSIYHWTLPPGATITSANADSSSITVSFETAGGNVSVTQTNPYGKATSSLAVSINIPTGMIAGAPGATAYEVRPNPFSDYTSIIVHSPSAEQIMLSIIDVQGVTCYSSSHYFTNNEFRVGNELSSDGVYFVQLVFGNEVKVLKIIKIQ